MIGDCPPDGFLMVPPSEPGHYWIWLSGWRGPRRPAGVVKAVLDSPGFWKWGKWSKTHSRAMPIGTHYGSRINDAEVE